MALPGWYPDPAGAPRTFRYWDGARWSATVASTPYGPPPPGMAAPTRAVSPPPATAPRPPVGRAVLGGFGPPTDGRSVRGAFESYATIGPLPAPPSSAPASSSYDVPATRGEPGPWPDRGRVLALVLLAVGVTLLIGVISFFVTRGLILGDELGADALRAGAHLTLGVNLR